MLKTATFDGDITISVDSLVISLGISGWCRGASRHRHSTPAAAAALDLAGLQGRKRCLGHPETSDVRGWPGSTARASAGTAVGSGAGRWLMVSSTMFYQGSKVA